MTRVEKLKKILLKISERGDVHEFFGLRGGYPVLSALNVEKAGRTMKENGVLLPIIRV